MQLGEWDVMGHRHSRTYFRVIGAIYTPILPPCLPAYVSTQSRVCFGCQKVYNSGNNLFAARRGSSHKQQGRSQPSPTPTPSDSSFRFEICIFSEIDILIFASIGAAVCVCVSGIPKGAFFEKQSKLWVTRVTITPNKKLN